MERVLCRMYTLRMLHAHSNPLAHTHTHIVLAYNQLMTRVRLHMYHACTCTTIQLHAHIRLLLAKICKDIVWHSHTHIACKEFSFDTHTHYVGIRTSYAARALADLSCLCMHNISIPCTHATLVCYVVVCHSHPPIGKPPK